MKKNISLILILIILIPVGFLLYKPISIFFDNMKKNLVLSELEIESSNNYYNSSNWIKGTIQNKSSKDYESVTVYVTLKNGDIKKECNFKIYSTIKAKETKDFHEMLFDCDGNLENYKVIKKKIDTN